MKDEFRLALRSLTNPGLSWPILVTMDEGADQDAIDAEEPHVGDVRDNNGRLEVHDGNGWLPLMQLPNPTPYGTVRQHDKGQSRHP